MFNRIIFNNNLINSIRYISNEIPNNIKINKLPFYVYIINILYIYID